MNETVYPDQQRHVTKYIILFGFILTLGWQTVILYTAPRFVWLWTTIGPDFYQQIPWLSQFLFGHTFVRWLIFLISIALVIYFMLQKPIRLFLSVFTLTLMVVITIIMDVSLYAPIYAITK